MDDLQDALEALFRLIGMDFGELRPLRPASRS